MEPDYLESRHAQYRRFALRLGVVTVFVPLALWLRDYMNDAQGGLRTLPYRILMSVGVLAYVTALALRAPRRVVQLTAYVAVLVIDIVATSVWGWVPIHSVLGYVDYMYMFLLAPLLLLPLSLRAVVGVLVMACLVPNLYVALGMTPGFSLALFNIVVWPACALAAFWLYEFDGVSRRLYAAQRQMREQAMRDPLTELGNRRYFDERGNGALALARRRGRPVSVLMIDIDHFKRVNDEHGHAAGDEVLRALGATLAASLRGGDICGRLGGEEFAAVLPDEDREGGAATAERLRRVLEQLSVDGGSAREPIRFTVSVGAAAFPQDGGTLEALLQCADARMYRAKEGGETGWSPPTERGGYHRPMSGPVVSKQELFERLAAGLAAQIAVVTPNRRLAQALAREFDPAQADKGLAVWESADILPFSAFVERLYEDALTSELAPELPLLLSEAQEIELWEQAIRASPWGAELLDPSRAATQAMHAWRLAHGWRIAGALASFPGNEDAAAFARWAAAYAKNEATDAARLPDVVAPLLGHAALRTPQRLVAYAFDVLTPQEPEFLDACAKRGIEVKICDPRKSKRPQSGSCSSPPATSSRRRRSGRGRRSRPARSASASWCPSSPRGEGKCCACSRAR